MMEVRNIVQEAVTKIIPKKMKCKKAEWFSEEALQMVEERREVKDKGERKRYTHLNAEFQRISRRNKKAFLSEQCKAVERKEKKKKRIGKSRDLFKKIGNSEGRFYARIGKIKGKNYKDIISRRD